MNIEDNEYQLYYEGKKTVLGYILLLLLLPAAALMFTIKMFQEYIEIEEYAKSNDKEEL